MKRASKFFVLFFSAALISCSPSFRISKRVQSFSEKFSHHAGFVLSDPQSGKTLVNVNGEKYFTPASNTKILTLLTALTNLGDSIPGLRYKISGDSLIIAGTGDPSFLYSGTYSNSLVFEFLKNYPGNIYLTPVKHVASPYGQGWSWDDFDADYHPERSAFPVYGNLATLIKKESSEKIIPDVFADQLSGGIPGYPFNRDQSANKFYFNSKKDGQVQIPFITSDALTTRLLSDTLNRQVILLSAPVKTEKIIYSIPADSLYKTMMQRSDNLIAEQLLMMVSDKLSDTLDTKPAIRHMLGTVLPDMPQKPVWVDGSGLSRYNQISPLDLVMIWRRILEIRPKDKIFPLLAASGRNGTLYSFNNGSAPFIFGKTGTLSNNYCLSGYLVTEKGRLLIFSSMNANFTVSAPKLRDELQKILTAVYENY
ncbi:MAG: D-alanyl-D-alanine carboxypeptidase [Cyclobacteriaceae bacterium]